MQKTTFFSSILLLIIYCVSFTFANEPLTGLDPFIKYPTEVYHYNLNSDLIFYYSYIKDIFTNIDTSGWNSGPKILPNIIVLIGILPALFSFGPEIYLIILSIIPPLLFIFIFSYFFSINKSDFFENFINLVSSFILIFFLYKFISGISYFFFDLQLNGFFYIEQTILFFGGRGFFSLLIFYYYFFFNKNNNIFKSISYPIVIVAFTLNDPFFVSHILSFIGFYFLLNLSKKNFYKLLYTLLFCIPPLVIFYLLSDDAQLYAKDLASFAKQKDEKKIYDLNVILISLISIFSMLFLYLILFLKNNNSKFDLILVLGSLLVFIFIVFSGIYISEYYSRYISVISLTTILLFFKVLQNCKQTILKTFRYSVYGLTIIFSLLSFNKSFNIFTEYRIEKYCIENLNKNYDLIATYWPGKILFEKSNRKFNFHQVFGALVNLNQYNSKKDNDWIAVFNDREWIYNTNWRKINENKAEGYLIHVNGLSNEFINQFLSKNNSRYFCNNKFILTDSLSKFKQLNN